MMTAATLAHGRPVRLWPLVVAVVLALVLGAAALSMGPDAETTLSATTPASPDDAVAAWLGEQGEAYAGACADGASYEGWCSRLVEDLGERQIHLAGPYATDTGADLLLERGADGDWAVVDAAPWPPVGEGTYLGPPWSPQTAIAGWWADQGVVHLRSCDEATEVAASAPGQAFACSAMVDGDLTTWRSSVAGSDSGDVRTFELAERPDRTFEVAAVR